MEAVFVDTSFWFTLANRKDSNHARAKTLLEACRDTPLITSNFVISETLTLILSRKGHPYAVAFGRRLYADGQVRIHRISEEDEREAWRIFQRHSDQEFSYTDCSCFALMRRLGIRQALHFDADFDWMDFRAPEL